MSSRIDDVNHLSVIIMRSPDDWLVELGASGNDGEEVNVGSHELGDMPTNKSLMETEILMTAWLAGRGFVHASPWRTYAGQRQ